MITKVSLWLPILIGTLACLLLCLIGRPSLAVADTGLTCDEHELTQEVSSLGTRARDSAHSESSEVLSDLLDDATRVGTHLEQCLPTLSPDMQTAVVHVIYYNRKLRIAILERLNRSAEALVLAQNTLDELNLAIGERPSDAELLGQRPWMISEVSKLTKGGDATPAPAESMGRAGTDYSRAESALSIDPLFSACQIHHVPEGQNITADDVHREFECSYRSADYRAVEVLGEAMIGSGVKLGQRDLYWLANAFNHRRNSEKALTYARLAYSRLNSSDKERCQTNVNRCRDLRELLIAMRGSYRARFASEDAAIRATAREAQAQAAEAAREAAAVAFSDSGRGIHSTETFSVSNSWELQWTYDCSNFSESGGNFIVEVSGDVEDVLVNQLGTSDSGTEYVHRGGTVYFKINSECDWTVKAIND